MKGTDQQKPRRWSGKASRKKWGFLDRLEDSGRWEEIFIRAKLIWDLYGRTM